MLAGILVARLGQLRKAEHHSVAAASEGERATLDLLLHRLAEQRQRIIEALHQEDGKQTPRAGDSCGQYEADLQEGRHELGDALIDARLRLIDGDDRVVLRQAEARCLIKLAAYFNLAV